MTDGVTTRGAGSSVDGATATDGVSGLDDRTDEYAHLRTKRRERRGNEATGEITSVYVGEYEVSITVSFDWRPNPVTLRYDLDDERDVCRLEAIAASHGFEFEQIGHTEGFRLPLVYTGAQWVPTAHRSYEEGEGSLGETFRSELHLLGRELARSPRLLRGAVRRVRGLDTRQAILGAIVVKKLLVVVLLAWLVL